TRPASTSSASASCTSYCHGPNASGDRFAHAVSRAAVHSIARDTTCAKQTGPPMPFTPILATLGYVLSPDDRRVLLIHRNTRTDDPHFGKYNGLGGKLHADEDIVAGMRREIREEAGL